VSYLKGTTLAFSEKKFRKAAHTYVRIFTYIHTRAYLYRSTIHGSES